MSLQLSSPPGMEVGAWHPEGHAPTGVPADQRDMLYRLGRPLYVTRGGALADGGRAELGAMGGEWPLLGYAPACRPQNLGDPAFLAAHGLTYAYVAGAMANGIGSAAIVEAMGLAGMLGFFGAGGLGLDRVEAAIDHIQATLGDRPYGFNLLHAPNEPDHEAATVELYLRRGVRLVEAAAYLDLTLPLIRYRTAGIHRGADGRAIAPNRVIAKVSRVEVANKFFAPPPAAMLAELVRRGDLTPEQAELAATLPVAQDLTAEADSGGHTDNRPAITLLPTMLALRDRLGAQHGYSLRVGAAGGLATPAGLAAAFAMGASYVVTGSINQACVESGSSDAVRTMLAGAQQADTAMAPAGDMFEMGVKVQVLKRGTLFAMRAQKLYELYRAHESLDAVPVSEREKLERDVFKRPLDAIWEETRAYFETRDPRQNERAMRDPKHRMALVFRWYLGHASRWANAGEAGRQADYQVWCGPAMGAFNEWARGSELEAASGRQVAHVARNLLVGAAALTRLAMLRTQGFSPDPLLAAPHVLSPEAIAACLA